MVLPKLLIAISLFNLISNVLAQSVVDDLNSYQTEFIKNELIEEKLLNISPSRKILLVTNETQSYAQGDFITLLLKEELVARALTARVANNISGIKIVKVYSQKLWKDLRVNSKIQILKGDDSFYINEKLKKLKKPESEAEEDVILTDDDVFSSEGDQLDGKNNRVIKTDNVIGASYGQLSSVDTEGQSKRYAHLSAHWAYQFKDNIWGEAFYGESKITGFPSSDIDTTLRNITLRIKYSITIPFNSYLLPYVGYQMVNASSPSAGQASSGGSLTQEEINQLNRENELVTEAEKKTVIFGVTVLKRLVPGWFAKIDLGTDLINIGFALEF